MYLTSEEKDRVLIEAAQLARTALEQVRAAPNMVQEVVDRFQQIKMLVSGEKPVGCERADMISTIRYICRLSNRPW